MYTDKEAQVLVSEKLFHMLITLSWIINQGKIKSILLFIFYSFIVRYSPSLGIMCNSRPSNTSHKKLNFDVQ